MSREEINKVNAVRRVCRRIRSLIWIASLIIGSGIFWGTLFAALVRIAFKLDEDKALLFIGCPLFVAYSVWGLRYFPAELHRRGYID